MATWEPRLLARGRDGAEALCGYWLLDLRNARDEDDSMVADAVVRYCTLPVDHTRAHCWGTPPNAPEGTTAAEEKF